MSGKSSRAEPVTIHPVGNIFDGRSGYRLRALTSEQRARHASDSTIKREWEELAIQWHSIANVAAQLADMTPLINIA